MSEIPSTLRYTAEHEYVRFDSDDEVTVGITAYAQGELGDVVYVELPTVGSTFRAHDVFGTIEAVKAVSELFSPVDGEVLDVNARLDKEPALVNTDPYGDGWMIRLRLSNPKQRESLLDAEAYKKHVGQ